MRSPVAFDRELPPVIPGTSSAGALGRRSPQRWSVLPLFLGVTVAMVGVGALIAGASAGTLRARVVGGNVPVNSGALDRRDIGGNNSPTLVRSPKDGRHLVLVNRIDTPRFSCALHVSSDGGSTWSETALPLPGGKDTKCGWPDAAFGAEGTLYVSFVTLEGVENAPAAVWVVTSTDGGRTLSPAAKALGPLAYQVRLAADSAVPRRVHLSWVQASAAGDIGFPEPGNPLMIARSDDGGGRWREAVQVSPPSRSRVLAPSIANGTRDALFVAYLDVGEDSLDYHGLHDRVGGAPYPGPWSLVVARSFDAGSTWQETTVDGGVVPIERVVALRPPAPSLAVDRERGRVYAGFHDGRRGDADVWVWTSADGGARFASPVRVNDTPVGDKTSQYLPALDVATDGRLDVVYYDRRGDRTNVMNEVSLQASADHGRTFGSRLRLSDRRFDSRVGIGSERGLAELGTRLAVTSTYDQAVAAWADARSGNIASNKQDIARAVVSFSSHASNSGRVLRWGGAAVVVIGVGLAAAAVVNRRRQVDRPS